MVSPLPQPPSQVEDPTQTLCLGRPSRSWSSSHDHHHHHHRHHYRHVDRHHQCDDRDPWLRLLHPCDGLLGSKTHPQFLSGDNAILLVIITLWWLLIISPSSLSSDSFWRCLHLLWPPSGSDWSWPEEFAGSSKDDDYCTDKTMTLKAKIRYT